MNKIPSPSEFAVVSIRPNQSGTHEGGGATVTGYQATGIKLSTVILYAYSRYPQGSWTKEFLIGPAWLDNERFDIIGKLDATEVEAWESLSYGQRRERVRPLLKKMLTERFGLVLHAASVEAPIYGLFLATKNPKLKQSVPNHEVPPDTHGVELASMGEGDGLVVPFDQGEKPVERFFSTPMQSLALFMSAFTDRIVEDKTGLTGRYDFALPKLDSISDPTVWNGMSTADPPPSTIWDVQAIGLTLKAMKGPVERWIIDHVERPTAN